MLTRPRACDSRVAFAAVCAAAGIAYLAIGLARDETGFAFTGFGVMIAYGAFLLLFGKRAEPLALFSGGATDERQAQLMQRASAAASGVVPGCYVASAAVTSAIV